MLFSPPSGRETSETRPVYQKSVYQKSVYQKPVYQKPVYPKSVSKTSRHVRCKLDADNAARTPSLLITIFDQPMFRNGVQNLHIESPDKDASIPGVVK